MPATKDRPGAIELALSEVDKSEFLEQLRNEPGLTIRRIKEMAEERGIKCGMGAANTFKRTFEQHLKNVEEASAAAELIQQLHQSGDSARISDASASVLALKVFKRINKSQEEDADAEELLDMSLVLKRLRDGDHRLRALEAKLKESDLKLAEMEAKQQAALAAADKLSQPTATGMTLAARNAIRLELGMPALTDATA